MDITKIESIEYENHALSSLQQQGNFYALRVRGVYHKEAFEYWLEYCYTIQDYASQSFTKVCVAKKWMYMSTIEWARILAGLQMEVLEIFCGSDTAYSIDLPEPQKTLKRLHVIYDDDAPNLCLDGYSFPVLEELSVVHKKCDNRTKDKVELSGYFPHLRKLELRSVWGDTINLLSCLSPNSLEELSLENCGKSYKYDKPPDLAPVELSDFYRLRVLCLSGNRLKELSFMPHTMPALEVLDIRGNRCCTVPSALLWFPRLRAFHFSRTRLARDSHISCGRDWIRIARYGREWLSLQEMDLLYGVLTTSPAYSPLTDQQQWLRFYRLIPVASFRRLLWMIFSARFGGDVEQVYLSASALRCAFVGKMPRRWLRKHMEGSRLCRVPLSEAEAVFVGEGLSGKQVARLLSTGKRIFTLDNLKRLYPHFPSLYLYQDKKHETDHLMTLWEQQEESSCRLVLQLLQGGGLPRKFFFRLWGVILLASRERRSEMYYTPMFCSLLRHYLSDAEYDFLEKIKGYVIERFPDEQFWRFFSGEFPFLCLSMEEFYEMFYLQGYQHLFLESQETYGTKYGVLAGMLLPNRSYADSLWRFYTHPVRGSLDISWVKGHFISNRLRENVLRLKVVGNRDMWWRGHGQYLAGSGERIGFFTEGEWKARILEIVCANESELLYWFGELNLTEFQEFRSNSNYAGYVEFSCPCYNEMPDGWRAEVYLQEKLIFSTDNQCNTLWFAEEEWRRKLKDLVGVSD